MTWDPRPPRLHTTCTPQDTRGPKRLWNAPAGFVVRERGDVDGTVLHDYLCPVHGRFELRVPRSAVPDEVACAHESFRGWPDGIAMLQSVLERQLEVCGLTSPWSPGTVAVWHSSGEVEG